MRSAQSTISLTVLIPVLAMLSAFAPLATDMYLPGFSHMTAFFQTTTGRIQVTISAFFLGLAVGQSIYGPLTDRFGRKPVLLAGLGIYTAATLGCVFATSIETFIALRFLQAVGGSAGMLIGRAIISDLFDRTEMARILSLMMMIMILAPIFAPIAGGWLVATLGWQSVFWVLLGFGLLSALLVALLIPETLKAENRQPLSFTHTFSVYAALLRSPRFIIPALSGALVQGTLFAYITGSEFVFTQLFGLSEQQFSWMFACNAVGIIIGTNGNRFSLKRWPIEKIFSAALAASVVFALLFLAVAPTRHLLLFVLPLWFVIACLGFVGANAVAIAMAASGTHAGSGSGLVGVMQFGMAFIVSSAVAATQNGTAYPMSAIMFACALAGSTLWFSTARLRGNAKTA